LCCSVNVSMRIIYSFWLLFLLFGLSLSHRIASIIWYNLEVLCFLCISLFELGLQPQLANLYPPVQYPVSRGTPMISPLVRWEHSEDRYVMKYMAEVSLQFSFENYLPFLTLNWMCHHYEDDSLETVQINIFC